MNEKKVQNPSPSNDAPNPHAITGSAGNFCFDSRKLVLVPEYMLFVSRSLEKSRLLDELTQSRIFKDVKVEEYITSLLGRGKKKTRQDLRL